MDTPTSPQGVNILAADLRTTVRKDVPFIPGAWVAFYDSLTVADMKRAQQMNNQEIKTIDDSINLVLSQVASWNFTDGVSPLPIALSSFDLFSNKLLSWFSETEAAILREQTDNKKKSPDSLSNSSPLDTPTA